ncbi:MAG: rod shape-determining protein MreD [Victivallales bacterium]|nr:rod shape-determining protein MreD [Victivallales bacterium]
MHSTSDKPRLVEIEIRFNPKLILEYMTSRNGFWRHASFLLVTLFWISTAFGLQLALPAVFPAWPWLPAAWGTAYLATRRGPVCAMASAFAIGLALDAICFQPLGPSSIILVLVALITRLFSDRIPWQKFFIANTLALSIVSTAVFVIGKAFFCRPAATLETDFALLPKFLLGGILLSLPICLLTFSVKDIIEGLLFPSDEEPSEE